MLIVFQVIQVLIQTVANYKLKLKKYRWDSGLIMYGTIDLVSTQKISEN